jgi:hypothetical protein
MKGFTKALLIILAVAAILSACIAPARPRLIRGSGDVIVEERNVSGFDQIAMAGAGRIIITQGDEESLTIETDDNLMEYIETRVRGNTLEIDFSDDIILSSGGHDVLEPSAGFIFRISVINLETVSVSGAAEIKAEKLKVENFEINFSGAGDIQVDDLNADRVVVNVSGAGDVELAGKVDYQDIILSGLGRYRGFDLESQHASVVISGAGGAELWVSRALDVVISGAGDVEYYGEPNVSPQISGLGRIQGLGGK